MRFFTISSLFLLNFLLNRFRPDFRQPVNLAKATTPAAAVHLTTTSARRITGIYTALPSIRPAFGSKLLTGIIGP